MQRSRMTKPNDIPKLLTIADLSVRWDMPRQSLHDKKGENKFPLQYNMSRTIGRHSSLKVTSSNTKKKTPTSRQEHNGKRDGISFLSCIWTRTTNKKWHFLCHLRVFTGTFRAIFGLLVISQKPQALPGLSRKVIAVSPYAL